MYGTTFDMSDEALDPHFVLPLGKAKVEREGLSRLSVIEVSLYRKSDMLLEFYI